MISDFGTTDDGRKVSLITLRSAGIECTAIDLGCSLRSLTVPDRDGVMRDVLLGYDDPDSYLHNGGHFGGVIGRYANRIRGGRLPIGDGVHQLSLNRGGNHMHGGFNAFDKRIWHIVEHTDDRVVFELDDPDGSEGYPGNLHVRCEYALSEGKLTAVYSAVSDEDTVCNVINHAYFNLGKSGDITDHTVELDSDMYTELDGDSLPTGVMKEVSVDMDLRDPTPLADMPEKGYDCNWAVRGYDGTLRHAASAWCDSTGIRLDVSTNMPGIQFYTGNGIKEGTAGKNGAVYGRRSGLCLETQHYPDAPNHPEFPSPLLRKGEVYRHVTEYRFSVF